MAFDTVTLTADFTDPQGNAQVGTISFTLSAPLLNATGNEIATRETQTVTLDSNGQISVSLIATTGHTDTVTPSGVTYAVLERFSNAPNRTYNIELDFADGATQDLADIAPTTAGTVTYGMSSLSTEAATVFDLTSGELDLDTQSANIVFAGPASGGAAKPTMRALVAADIPDISATYQPLDSQLTSLAALADAAGSLTNDGAGVLSWTAATGDLLAANNLSDVADASTSRTNLVVDVAGTDNSTNVTLAASADAILGISGQALSADTQADNTVLAGPTSGGPTAPTFRILVAGDIPDLSATYQPLDADLTAIAGVSGVNGDIIIRSGGAWTKLAKGSDDEVLTLAAGLPSWAAAGGGAEAFNDLTDVTADTTTGKVRFGTGSGAGDYSLTIGNYANTANRTYTIALGSQAGRWAADVNGIFLGASAGAYASSRCTVVGYNAAITSGSGKTDLAVFGYEALKASTTGAPGPIGSTVIGSRAGLAVTSGTGNTLVGKNCGDTITTGATNSILGYTADVDAAARANTVVLGNAVISPAEDGSVIIGTGSGASVDYQLRLVAEGLSTIEDKSGTDTAGADAVFIGGKGTGNAVSGSIEFWTGDAGGSGSTLQTVTEKFQIAADGGMFSVGATGGSQGVDTLNASGIYDDGVQLTADADEPVIATFSEAGTLATKTGAFRWYADQAYTITEVRASVGTAPTGATLICDVHKNGTTIFTTQANRPTIAISGNTDMSGAPDVTALADDDYITVDIDQIGSTIAGADLTVQIYMTKD